MAWSANASTLRHRQRVVFEALEALHRLKTGALIRASVLLGAHSAEGATDQQLADFQLYADCIGLAFQIQDDILDVTADTASLGKPQGSDQHNDKTTYVSLLGLEQAQSKASEMTAGNLRTCPLRF